MCTVKKYNSILKNRVPLLVQEAQWESEDTIVNSPKKVDDFVRRVLKLHQMTEEYLYMIACNMKMEILGIFEVSHGTVNQSFVCPREIYMKALLIGASGIILIHNHPSQDVTPSRMDLTATERIKQAGVLIGIDLLDHIIIGNEYYSMKDHEILAD